MAIGHDEKMIEQNEQIIQLLQKIKEELEEIKRDTKITSDFATLRSQIIKKTQGQWSTTLLTFYKPMIFFNLNHLVFP